MSDIQKIFNENQKVLQTIILGKDIEKTIELILNQNALTHCSEVSGIGERTLEDQIWEHGETLRFHTEDKMYSAAWHLWHSARIEDICSHHFFGYDDHILSRNDYAAKMNVRFICTGNSFSLQEMHEFNTGIDLDQLHKYRNDVGRETRVIVNTLTTELLKKKVSTAAIDRIRFQGYVDNESEWLLEFWGKKKLAGIVTMPLTRHLIVHLNDALKAIGKKNRQSGKER
jgi:hypothetical protein